ncbi:MAG: DNA-protecting protein DprA [bacterium]|nr:DNA-protecting protein DprA [bacterium]
MYPVNEALSWRITISYSELDVAVVALREYGGVGARTFQQLIQHFATPQGIFDSEPGEIAALPRMSPEKEEQIRASIHNAELIRDRLGDYANRGIRVTTICDPFFPESLLEQPDPPPLLYYRGNLDICRDNCVAIVGSHEASAEGIAESVRLGAAIGATGTVVVSGLARGIDSGAHIGVLKSDGKTIAVLGCGFDEIYPPENEPLAQNIIERGLLISEYPPEATVEPGKLLARNRIIVGMSKSVIVVEITSGTGGTVSAMAETVGQGKSLFTCFNPNLEGAASNKVGAVELKNPDDWKMVLRYMV